METRQMSGKRLARFVEVVVEWLIPHRLRDALVGDLLEELSSMSLKQSIRCVAQVVFQTIMQQIRTTTDFRLAGAQAVAMYAAFAGAAISLPALLVVALFLSILVFRRAQRYPARTSSQELRLDSLIAVTFCFASQAVIGAFAPSLTLSSELMVRGAVLAPLALCMLQMIFPDKPGGPETLEERSDDAYRQTFAMNILFLLAFGSLTLTNPELLPEGIAGRDLLLGALPLSVLFVTFRLQMDVISPVRVETRRPDLLRSRCLRLWGSDKTRSSLWYRCAEIVILAPLGLTPIWAIGIGLSSGAAGDDWFYIGENTAAFVILVLVSLYVHDENKTTLKILREEIDALERKRLAAQAGR